jgi:hypothetical protein
MHCCICINLLSTFFIGITVQEVLESSEVLMVAGMHPLDVSHLLRVLVSPLLQARPQAQRQQNPQAEIQTGRFHSRLDLEFQFQFQFQFEFIHFKHFSLKKSGEIFYMYF